MLATMSQQEFLTIDEIADLLRVSRTTVTNLIDSGELAATRVGRQYRISQSDWQNFLNRKTSGKRAQEEQG